MYVRTRYALLLLALLLLLLAPTAQAQATFIVNVPVDGVDPNPGDGVCEVTVNENACSFRAALQEANALDASAEIRFDDITFTAVMTLEFGPLPNIIDQVVIDGYTSPEYDDSVPPPEAPAPAFYIDGSNLTNSGPEGLRFENGSDGSVVRGLGVINFPDDGIILANAGNITVQGCYVGVEADGVTAAPNGHNPEFDETAGIGVSTNGNDIGQSFNGTTFAGRGNVVSGNDVTGITIDTGDDNRLRGNIIGLSADGLGLLPNAGYGVRVFSGTDNGIGAFTTSERAGNVITGNSAGGVRVDSDGNFVRSNYIGTGPSGLVGVVGAGAGNGVELFSANNVVGGAASTATNVIADAEGQGLLITGTGNLIRNNHIGVNTDGTGTLGNEQNGIKVEAGADNTTIRDNLVGGNGFEESVVHDGILILSNNNVVRGNLVGTNDEGDDLGNGFAGIQVAGTGTLVGGTEDGTENIVGFNARGIWLGAGGSGNTVQGNFVGTNPSGDSLGNGTGIWVSTPSLIGGSDSGARNVVSGNGAVGIRLVDDAGGSTVQGNYVGFTPDGTAVLPNGGDGIFVTRPTLTIGGTAPGEGNVIAGNGRDGISLEGADANEAFITGNRVGLGPGGKSLPNGQHGVHLLDSAHHNQIGAGNVIAANEGAGVRIQGVITLFNRVSQNALFANGGLGIDLGEEGVTPNDPNDEDVGPNHLQNHPEVLGAGYDATANEVTVSYRVDTGPSQTEYPLDVEFYRASADGEEGRAYLGDGSYTEDDYDGCGAPPCSKTVTFTPADAVEQSNDMVATASSFSQNTSEFSPPVGVAGRLFVVNSTGDTPDDDPDGVCETDEETCTLRAALQEANLQTNLGVPDQIHFDLPDDPPHLIQPQLVQPDIALPDITDPVIIDGWSEPDYDDDGVPVIEVNGAEVGTLDGLVFDGAPGSRVQGLAITGFEEGDALKLASNGITVRGCYLGVKPDGVTAEPNRRGVFVVNMVENNVIGTTAASHRNVISGNVQDGLFIVGDHTALQNNAIGVDANGDPLGNGDSGVLLNAENVTVGGTGPGEKNVIAHNGDHGVEILDIAPPNNGHTIRGNAVFANGDLGIDLGDDGPTPNDPGDGDTGPNNLQNHPEITSADYDPDADEVTVTYLVDTDPSNAAYPLAVEVFVADEDAQEGRLPLGEDSYTTYYYNDCAVPPCEKSITFTPAPGLDISRTDFVLATATDADGNTSEFSAQAVPLPVELTALEATVEGQDVILSWQTASETNNDGFAVERRAHPTSDIQNPKWTKVAFVEGAGTTSEPQSYSYRATGLNYGAHVFRLKQIDRDGMATYSEEVEAQVTLAERYALSEAYPNPFRQRATLELAVREAQEVRVAVYDALGRRVAVLHDGALAANETHRFSVGAGGLSSGLYLLRVAGEKFAATRRLVLMR